MRGEWRNDEETPSGSKSQWRYSDRDDMVWDWLKTDWPILLFVAVVCAGLVLLAVLAGDFQAHQVPVK